MTPFCRVWYDTQ